MGWHFPPCTATTATHRRTAPLLPTLRDLRYNRVVFVQVTYAARPARYARSARDAFNCSQKKVLRREKSLSFSEGRKKGLPDRGSSMSKNRTLLAVDKRAAALPTTFDLIVCVICVPVHDRQTS